MRLTIVDAQMGTVQDYLQVGTVTPETFAQVVAWAAQYRNAGYRWLVSPNGEMPRHAQGDEFGRCAEAQPEPDVDDGVRFCPGCERPNQFGEECYACARDRQEEHWRGYGDGDD